MGRKERDGRCGRRIYSWISSTVNWREHRISKASSLMIAKFGQENSKLIFYFYIVVLLFVRLFVCFCFCFLVSRLQNLNLKNSEGKKSSLWRKCSHRKDKEQVNVITGKKCTILIVWKLLKNYWKKIMFSKFYFISVRGIKCLTFLSKTT